MVRLTSNQPVDHVVRTMLERCPFPWEWEGTPHQFEADAVIAPMHLTGYVATRGVVAVNLGVSYDDEPEWEGVSARFEEIAWTLIGGLAEHTTGDLVVERFEEFVMRRVNERIFFNTLRPLGFGHFDRLGIPYAWAALRPEDSSYGPSTDPELVTKSLAG